VPKIEVPISILSGEQVLSPLQMVSKSQAYGRLPETTNNTHSSNGLKLNTKSSVKVIKS
jgi:hypothetical protein